MCCRATKRQTHDRVSNGSSSKAVLSPIFSREFFPARSRLTRSPAPQRPHPRLSNSPHIGSKARLISERLFEVEETDNLPTERGFLTRPAFLFSFVARRPHEQYRPAVDIVVEKNLDFFVCHCGLSALTVRTSTEPRPTALTTPSEREYGLPPAENIFRTRPVRAVFSEKGRA